MGLWPEKQSGLATRTGCGERAQAYVLLQKLPQGWRWPPRWQMRPLLLRPSAGCCFQKHLHSDWSILEVCPEEDMVPDTLTAITVRPSLPGRHARRWRGTHLLMLMPRQSRSWWMMPMKMQTQWPGLLAQLQSLLLGLLRQLAAVPCLSLHHRRLPSFLSEH